VILLSRHDAGSCLPLICNIQVDCVALPGQPSQTVAQRRPWDNSTVAACTTGQHNGWLHHMGADDSSVAACTTTQQGGLVASHECGRQHSGCMHDNTTRWAGCITWEWTTARWLHARQHSKVGWLHHMGVDDSTVAACTTTQQGRLVASHECC
jgi:hypothetical protein